MGMVDKEVLWCYKKFEASLDPEGLRPEGGLLNMEGPAAFL